jgi:hypothetical protein
MNVRFCEWTGIIVATALVAACKKDPTADLAGKPALLSASPNKFTLKVRDSVNVSVRILDGTLTPLQGVVTATSGGAGATVAQANVPPDPTGTSSVFTVRGVAPQTTAIRFSSGSLRDSAQVTVTP